MHKRRPYFLLFLLSYVGLSCANISAQETLSLEKCRELAIENNKKLKVATEKERIAYYEKKDAFLQYFPKLAFNGAYFRNEKNLQLIPSTITIPPISIPGIQLPIPDGGLTLPVPDNIRKVGELDIQNIWVGGFTLTQPLFAGGKIVAYNDIREYAKELASAQKQMQYEEIIVETDNTYWQVVSLTSKKKLAKSFVDLLAKMNSDVATMEEEGVATKADVLSVKVKLNEAEITLTQVENGLSLSKMLLNQICGMELSNPIVLVDESVPVSSVSQADMYPNVSEALANRLEIKSLTLANKIYEKRERIARAEFLPEVGLVANYLWTNPSAFDGIQKKFGGMWNVGVVAKVPLNVFSISNKMNAAKAETTIQKLELAEAKEKIELQINQTSYKLSEANKKLIATERNVEKANENLRYANAGFEEGVIPASDLMAAQTAWLAAQSNLLDAQIDLRLCKLYLNKAVGKNLNVNY